MSSSFQAPKNLVDRRGFLRVLGLSGMAVGGAAVLAACSSPSGSTVAGSATASAAANYGTMALQFSWIKNIEFSGEYFATENGYYTAAGFDGVTLLAGGSQTTAESVVLSGQALVGLSSPSITAPSIINEQAPLKIIGATYQKNPFCLLSLKEKTPIATVADLKGKTVAVNPGADGIFKGFLTANGLTSSDVTMVAAQYSASIVETGGADAYLAYINDEPYLVEADGFTPVILSLADNGLPLVAETFTVTQDSIDTKRDLLKAFLLAEIRGWTDAIRDPNKSADYAVNTYGKDQGLDLAEQVKEANGQIPIIVTAETDANGLFSMSDALVKANIDALAAMGYTIAAKDLFDLTLLDEVYAENPSLIVKLAS